MTEIFSSLQGESTLAGRPFVFVRLTGCNLRCAYCDSAYAFKGGTLMSVAEVVDSVSRLADRPDGAHVSEKGPRPEIADVLLTGGEPLLQRPTPEIARSLTDRGYRVSVETHGEADFAPLLSMAPETRVVMDIKTPGSLMNRGREKWRLNLRHLRATDELKFVIAAPDDYHWARSLIENDPELRRYLARAKPEILFSPAQPGPGQPGAFPGVEPRWLAEKILADRLPVRFQIQLHKLLWGNARGV